MDFGELILSYQKKSNFLLHHEFRVHNQISILLFNKKFHFISPFNASNASISFT